MATKTQTRRLKAKTGATKGGAMLAARGAMLEAKASAELAGARKVRGFRGVTVTMTLERVEKIQATRPELVESLGDVLGILAEVGGFMKPEHQALAMRARRRHGRA